MNVSFPVLLALGLLLQQDKADKARSPDKNELQGEWAVLVWDYEGYWMTAPSGAIGDHYRNLRVTFTADRLIIRPSAKKWDIWWGVRWLTDYKCDPTKDPKQIDLRQVLLSDDGKESSLSDSVWRGIYE